MVGTSGPHQWSVEMWRLHVQGAKSYSRFRVDLELDSFWVMYGFEHVFSKLPVLWHVGKMRHVTYLDCEKSYLERSMDHKKASSQDKGLQRRRPSEANVSKEATAGALLEFVDLTREYCRNAASIVIGDMVGTGRDRRSAADVGGSCNDADSAPAFIR